MMREEFKMCSVKFSNDVRGKAKRDAARQLREEFKKCEALRETSSETLSDEVHVRTEKAKHRRRDVSS